MKEIYFTFLFSYLDKNKKKSMIEFCASTKSDAIELFREWCVTDEKQKRPYRICDIKVVYNKEDHAEYGKAYRTPEEYLVYSMLPE